MEIQSLLHLINEHPDVAEDIVYGGKTVKKVSKKEELDLRQEFDRKLKNALASLPKPKDGKSPTRQELVEIIETLLPTAELLNKVAVEAAEKVAKKVPKPTIKTIVEEKKEDAALKKELELVKEKLQKLAKNQQMVGKGIGASYTDTDVLRVLNREGYETIDKTVVVKTASQLAGELQSDVVYFIDGMIDMGSTQIVVPSGGLNLQGASFFVSGLYSTENSYTMFTNSGTSGNFSAENLELSVSGTSSQLFDLDNNESNGAAELINCNVGSFSRTTTSFGEISSYRQIRFDGCGFFNYSDGLTLSGTMAGGLAVTDSVVISAQSGSALFKEGTSLIINGSSTSNINASSGANAANTIIWDFQESNIGSDGGFVLESARFGNLTDPLPNLSETSTKVKFTDCLGIRNTFIGAVWHVSTEAETVLTADTITKLAGTTTYNQLVYFSGSADNAVQYESTDTRDFVIDGTVVLNGGIGFAGNSLTLTVRQWDNSASSYTELETYTKTVPNSIGVAEQLDMAFFAFATLDEDDRIELWITNNGAATNATMTQASFLRVTPRS